MCKNNISSPKSKLDLDKVVYETQPDNKVEVTIYSGDDKPNIINALVLKSWGVKTLKYIQSIQA